MEHGQSHVICRLSILTIRSPSTFQLAGRDCEIPSDGSIQPEMVPIVKEQKLPTCAHIERKRLRSLNHSLESHSAFPTLICSRDLKDAETLPNHCLRLSCGHSITERYVCAALHTVTNALTFTSSIRTPKTFSLPSHHIITHTDTYKHIHKYMKDSSILRNKGRLLNNTIIIIITTSLT